MKTTLLTVFICISCTLITRANTGDMFTYDASLIDQQLAQLKSLEDYVNANPGITLSVMQSEKSALISELSFNSSSSSGLKDDNNYPLGISPFLWGCVGGVWGIAIVYFMAEDDKEQIEKSVKGCVVSRVTCCAAYVCVYVLILAGYLSIFSSYYYW
jgi:hypothetical protein